MTFSTSLRKLLKYFLRPLILEIVSELPEETKLNLKRFSFHTKELKGFDKFISSFQFETRKIRMKMEFKYSNHEGSVGDAIEFDSLSELVQFLKNSGVEKFYENSSKYIPIGFTSCVLYHTYNFISTESESWHLMPVLNKDIYRLDSFKEISKNIIENLEKYPEYLV